MQQFRNCWISHSFVGFVVALISISLRDGSSIIAKINIYNPPISTTQVKSMLQYRLNELKKLPLVVGQTSFLDD